MKKGILANPKNVKFDDLTRYVRNILGFPGLKVVIISSKHHGKGLQE
jgi:hypothetical protein